MNIRSYIESGLLEQFAKGELTRKETAAMQYLLEENLELGEELELIYIRLERENLLNSTDCTPIS